MTTAIITGASTGIGKATALLFAKNGYSLVLNARNEANLKDVQAELEELGNQVIIVCGDVSKEQTQDKIVAAALAKFGHVDVLINNAGGGMHLENWETLTLEQWNDTFRANLDACFWLSRKVLTNMRKRGKGRIVNVSSLAGRQYSLLAGIDYASAKAGLIGMTRQLAMEVGPYGINVNAVAPGITFTERIRNKWENKSEEEQTALLANIPLRKAATPREIAAPIYFLASEDASYITGATLDVNGGVFMG